MNAQSSEPKPTLGRIVIYNLVTSAGKSELVPAIIQNVAEDGGVRLHVFAAHLRKTVDRPAQGDNPGEWNWPKRD